MKRTELSTIIGIFASVLVVIYAISFNGKVRNFIDFPSMWLVLIGTFLITSACFSFKEVILTQRSIMAMIAIKPEDPYEIANSMLKIAEVSYKKGLLNIEKSSIVKNQDYFFSKHLNMVIDGEKAAQIEYIIEREINATNERYLTMISILKKAAEIAPSMGLIGTIIGLVQMLGSIDNVKMIGPAMAVALLTTFYGAVLSYVILFPLSAKFEKNLAEELLIMRIYMLTLISMSKADHPSKLELLLNSILPPEKKVIYFKHLA